MIILPFQERWKDVGWVRAKVAMCRPNYNTVIYPTVYSLHYHHRRCGCGYPSPTSLGDAGSIKIKGGWVFAIRKLHHSNNSVIKRVQSVRHHSTSGAGCTLVSAQLTGFSCYWKDFASEWKRMTFLFDRQTDRQLGHLVPPPRAFANNPRGFCAAARGSASSPRRLAFTTHPGWHKLSWENK